MFAGVPVEGASAARDLSDALQKVARTDAEVVLLVRGGGSFEDLMPFNDEGLARTIANCEKPVVTGIGHEPDTSIADMVSDMRASTPTAAAEAVSPYVEELNESIDTLKARMEGSLSHRLHRSVVYLDAIASRPLFKDPTSLFASDLQITDALQDRLERVGQSMVSPRQDKLSVLAQRFEGALPRKFSQMESETNALASSLKRCGSSLLANRAHQVSLANASLVRLGKTLLTQPVSQAAVVTARLNDLSPLRTLERGWSIARSDQGTLIKSVSDVRPNDAFTLQLIDGALACRVEDEAVSELNNIISMEESHD